MRLEIAIEDLVLLGFDPRDRHRIHDAIERELLSGLGRADLMAGPRPIGPPGTRDSARLAASSALAQALERRVATSIQAALATLTASPARTAAPRSRRSTVHR